MKVETLEMDKEAAREAYLKYRGQVDMSPADKEIAAIYRKLARGNVVIRALESIRQAGLGEDGLPRLAIMRADQPECWWKPDSRGGVFCADRWPRGRESTHGKNIRIAWPGLQPSGNAGAVVPLIPIYLRPKTGLAQYHILWEAEWSKVYPRDPYLLRRFGGDAWLVVAAWELTEVERAVMHQRVVS